MNGLASRIYTSSSEFSSHSKNSQLLLKMLRCIIARSLSRFYGSTDISTLLWRVVICMCTDSLFWKVRTGRPSISIDSYGWKAIS